MSFALVGCRPYQPMGENFDMPIYKQKPTEEFIFSIFAVIMPIGGNYFNHSISRQIVYYGLHIKAETL